MRVYGAPCVTEHTRQMTSRSSLSEKLADAPHGPAEEVAGRGLDAVGLATGQERDRDEDGRWC